MCNSEIEDDCLNYNAIISMISDVNIYTAILLGKNSYTFVIYVSIAELPVLEYMYIFIYTIISEHAT